MPLSVTQAAEAAEDVHRLVGAAAAQLKALTGGAAAVRSAAEPLAAALDTGLEHLAGIGGYAQVCSRFSQVSSACPRQPTQLLLITLCNDGFCPSRR